MNCEPNPAHRLFLEVRFYWNNHILSFTHYLQQAVWHNGRVGELFQRSGTQRWSFHYLTKCVNPRSNMLPQLSQESNKKNMYILMSLQLWFKVPFRIYLIMVFHILYIKLFKIKKFIVSHG